MKFTDDEVVSTKSVIDPSLSLDDIPFLNNRIDMANGYRWIVDDDGKRLYRLQNGTKIYFDEQVINDTETCYSTYLNSSDSNKCKSFINCINDGDSRSLRRCMDVLKDKDLYKVAKIDYNNVSPQIVDKVLSKFNIKINTSTGLYPSIHAWLKTIQDPEIKQAIDENQGLLTYLGGLIDYSNITKGGYSDRYNRGRSKMGRDLNIPFGVHIPSYKPKTDRLIQSLQQYSAGIGNRTRTRMMANELGLMNNVVYTGTKTGLRNMMGGSSDSHFTCNKNADGTCISRYGRILISLEKGLEDVGINLSEPDKKAIREFIKTTEKNEMKLEKLMNIFKTFINVARSYNIKLDGEPISSNVLNLSELHTPEDVESFFKGHVNMLRKKINESMTMEDKKVQLLIGSLIPRIISSQ
jgi:hypothetical protein